MVTSEIINLSCLSGGLCERTIKDTNISSDHYSSFIYREKMVTQYAISRTKFPNVDAQPAHCPIESRIFYSLPRLDPFAKLYREHRT